MNLNLHSYEKMAIVSGLSIAAIASGLGAAMVTATAAKVALGVATFFLGAASVGSMIAALISENTRGSKEEREQFYTKLRECISVATVGFLQVIVNSIMQVLIQRGAEEIGNRLFGERRQYVVIEHR